MLTALSQRLATPLDRSLPPLEAEQAIGAALTTRLYQLLATAALKQPRDVPILQGYVARQAAIYLSDEAATRLETAFLSAALAAPDAEWRPYEELIVASATSRDPLAVLRMLEVYERTSDTALRELLGDLLVSRVGVRPKTMSVRDVARAVRQALGASATIAASERDRWLLLRGRATAPLARPARPRRISTSNCSIAPSNSRSLARSRPRSAQGEAGLALFDDVLRREAEPPEEMTADEPAGSDVFAMPAVKTAAGKLSAAQQQAFERLLAQFEKFSSVPQVKRESNMRRSPKRRLK